jgi:hypothetical protein
MMRGTTNVKAICSSLNKMQELMVPDYSAYVLAEQKLFPCI